jgi:OOP family OmpA-OmpF porin
MKNIVTLMLLTPVIAFSQISLVQNGTFEDVKCEPHSTGDICYAKGMSSSNNTSVDLYSKKACYSYAMAPNNYMGTQEPSSGDHYAGIIAYYGDEYGLFRSHPGYQNYSEYLQVELTQPLEAGKVYAINFKTSLAEESAFAISGLGMYFSKDKLDAKSNSYLDTIIVPHLIVPEMAKNKEWSVVEGYYKASGGEKFLTIGAFKNYMSIEKVIPEYTNNSRKAYYYIDDVSLTPVVNTVNSGYDVVLMGGCFQLEKLNFELDKAVILPESYDELNGLAMYLKRYPFLTIYLDGYTDKTGTDTRNQPLSEQRAAAVKNYLVNKGVRGSRLKSKGYGSSNPIDTENANSMTNRRVEITACYAN